MVSLKNLSHNMYCSGDYLVTIENSINIMSVRLLGGETLMVLAKGNVNT